MSCTTGTENPIGWGRSHIVNRLKPSSPHERTTVPSDHRRPFQGNSSPLDRKRRVEGQGGGEGSHPGPNLGRKVLTGTIVKPRSKPIQMGPCPRNNRALSVFALAAARSAAVSFLSYSFRRETSSFLASPSPSWTADALTASSAMMASSSSCVGRGDMLEPVRSLSSRFWSFFVRGTLPETHPLTG